MQCNGNFKQWFNIFLIISEAWQGYDSKAYEVLNHNLKLQCKKFSRTRDIPNFPTQGWAGTAFCTRKRSETYPSTKLSYATRESAMKIYYFENVTQNEDIYLHHNWVTYTVSKEILRKVTLTHFFCHIHFRTLFCELLHRFRCFLGVHNFVHVCHCLDKHKETIYQYLIF